MNVPSIQAEWAGRTVGGKYSLLRWLGGSTSSGVFLTKIQERDAALKLVSAPAADARSLLDAWTATKALSYPHLMPLLDFGRCQVDNAELLFTVTEYAEEDLAQVLPNRPLTPSETRELLAPVLDTLLYLHGRGFVHGHLKPSNLQVVDNQLKLSSDSVQAVGSRGIHPMAGGIYDAPERATSVITPASDAWSLGITLIEALTQRPPAWDIFTRLEPRVPESIPKPFAEIAQECLRLDPSRRCSLENVKAHLESGSPLKSQPSQSRAKERTKVRVVALLGAVLVVLGLVAILQFRFHKKNAPLPTHAPLPTEDRRPVPTVAAPQPEPAASEHQATQRGTIQGEVIHRVLPDVPRRARMTIQGTVAVKIRVAVDATGTVSDARFESSGPSKYFAKLALQAAREWRFRPAQVDGQKVSRVWTLRFQFRQTGTEVFPVEQTP